MDFSLLAANEGYLDDVDANKIVDFEAAMHAYLRENFVELLDQLNESADYNDEIEAAMKAAVDDFKKNGAY